MWRYRFRRVISGPRGGFRCATGRGRETWGEPARNVTLTPAGRASGQGGGNREFCHCGGFAPPISLVRAGRGGGRCCLGRRAHIIGWKGEVKWYPCLSLTPAALGPHRPGRVGASVRAEPKTAPHMGRLAAPSMFKSRLRPEIWQRGDSSAKLATRLRLRLHRFRIRRSVAFFFWFLAVLQAQGSLSEPCALERPRQPGTQR